MNACKAPSLRGDQNLIADHSDPRDFLGDGLSDLFEVVRPELTGQRNLINFVGCADHVIQLMITVVAK